MGKCIYDLKRHKNELGEEVLRYLQIMRYNVVKDYWHDCSSLNGLSHTIFA